MHNKQRVRKVEDHLKHEYDWATEARLGRCTLMVMPDVITASNLDLWQIEQVCRVGKCCSSFIVPQPVPSRRTLSHDHRCQIRAWISDLRMCSRIPLCEAQMPETTIIQVGLPQKLGSHITTCPCFHLILEPNGMHFDRWLRDARCVLSRESVFALGQKKRAFVHPRSGPCHRQNATIDTSHWWPE